MIAPASALTLLADKLQPGERVLFAVRPDMWVTFRNKMFLLWVGIPWCAASLSLYFAGRASPFVALPLAMIGIGMVVAPIIMMIDTRYTIYAITDRRALIAHHGVRPAFVSCAFEQMDAKPEIVTAGGKGGHLYFASAMSPKQRDVDYTGKLGFRDLDDPQQAARELEGARKSA